VSVCFGWPVPAWVIHRTCIVIDGVPDAPAAGYLVLPLLQSRPTDLDDTECAFQRMLSLVDAAWIAGQRHPRPVEVLGSSTQ